MAHALQGYALESLGRVALAESAYGRAIELDESILLPRLRLGILHGKQRNFGLCIALLEPVLQRIKQDPEALFYLSQILPGDGARRRRHSNRGRDSGKSREGWTGRSFRSQVS